MIFSKQKNSELEHDLRSIRTIARGITDFAQARQGKKTEFLEALDAIEDKLTKILKNLSEGTDDEK